LGEQITHIWLKLVSASFSFTFFLFFLFFCFFVFIFFTVDFLATVEARCGIKMFQCMRGQLVVRSIVLSPCLFSCFCLLASILQLFFPKTVSDPPPPQSHRSTTSYLRFQPLHSSPLVVCSLVRFGVQSLVFHC
jgi:hypothetical protein